MRTRWNVSNASNGKSLGQATGSGQLSVVVSPDFDAYASGQIPAAGIRCALCQRTPCDCPKFGTPEYFALINVRHGRTR